MKRWVALFTTNDKKYTEYVHIFSLYGIDVEHVNEKFKEGATQQAIARRSTLPMFIIYESNQLYVGAPVLVEEYDPEVHTSPTVAQHVCSLSCVGLGKYTTYMTRSVVQGVLRPGADRKPDAFGFDDIFFNDAGMSNYELAQRNQKNSARNRVLSNLFNELFQYKELTKHNYLDCGEYERAVDFENSCAYTTVMEAPCMSMLAERSFSKTMARAALNNGVFFRKASNRRVKNYWCPGLNAGIPAVAKKDSVHEEMFMFHDVCHFLYPDLLPIGSKENVSVRRQYITQRMVGEAASMVLADMVFAQELKDVGLDYDFTQRKIWPIWKASGLKVTTSNICLAIMAHTKMCLSGDTSGWLNFNDSQEMQSALKDFWGKFESFFVCDYNWTRANYDAIVAPQGHWSHSSGMVETQLYSYSFGNTSIENHIVVQARIFIQHMHDADRKTSTTSPETVKEFAFERYVAGQSKVFHDFSWADLHVYKQAVDENMVGKCTGYRERVRKLFDTVFIKLHERGAITYDDCNVYKEVYPIFPPCYVNYDENKEWDIERAKREALGDL